MFKFRIALYDELGWFVRVLTESNSIKAILTEIKELEQHPVFKHSLIFAEEYLNEDLLWQPLARQLEFTLHGLSIELTQQDIQEINEQD